MLPIKVFIGMSERFESIKTLTARSILRNTTVPVDIQYIYTSPESGCTGFSNARYDIEYGIYLDPDMIVLGDIADLWAYHKPGKFVCVKDGSTEVAVIDCKHNCRSKHEQHLLPKACDIPLEWNCEDELKPGAKLLHFTDLKTQPWFYDHPNAEAVAVYEDYK